MGQAKVQAYADRNGVPPKRSDRNEGGSENDERKHTGNGLKDILGICGLHSPSESSRAPVLQLDVFEDGCLEIPCSSEGCRIRLWSLKKDEETDELIYMPSSGEWDLVTVEGHYGVFGLSVTGGLKYFLMSQTRERPST